MEKRNKTFETALRIARMYLAMNPREVCSTVDPLSDEDDITDTQQCFHFKIYYFIRETQTLSAAITASCLMTDEEYVTLLAHYLSCRKINTSNLMLKCPEIMMRIYNQLSHLSEYVIVFDEIEEAVQQIMNPYTDLLGLFESDDPDIKQFCYMFEVTPASENLYYFYNGKVYVRCIELIRGKTLCFEEYISHEHGHIDEITREMRLDMPGLCRYLNLNSLQELMDFFKQNSNGDECYTYDLIKEKFGRFVISDENVSEETASRKVMEEFFANKEKKNYYKATVNRLSANRRLTFMCQFDDGKLSEVRALKEKYGEKEYQNHLLEVVTDDDVAWDTDDSDLKLVDFDLEKVYHQYGFTIHELLPNGKMREFPTMLRLTDEEYIRLLELRLRNQQLTFNTLRFEDSKLYEILRDGIDEYYCDERGYYQNLVDAPYLVTMDEVNADVEQYIEKHEEWADNRFSFYDMKMGH